MSFVAVTVPFTVSVTAAFSALPLPLSADLSPVTATVPFTVTVCGFVPKYVMP